MLHTLAIAGYRSLQEVVLPLGQLNLITGPNGSGKSSVYRSLRLLSDAARGTLIQTLAKEGGLPSVLWAGPETITNEMRLGQTPIQGGLRKKAVALKLGYSSDEFSYTIELGLPTPSGSMFSLDPVVKRECIWRGHDMRASSLAIDRRSRSLRSRPVGGKWEQLEMPLLEHASILTEFADPYHAPEVIALREDIRSWRFYDQLRGDADSPARTAEVGTYTPSLADDGRDLAAALQTIREVGDAQGLEESISDAFPGSELRVRSTGPRLEVALQQPGMLRPLSAPELSEGTLRFLLLTAALFTPRPPSLMVLNEPETSLHPELLPALARLIIRYAEHDQIFVVTHAADLIGTLAEQSQCAHFVLDKSVGATEIEGQDLVNRPRWKWPAR